ncbi:hypothetical protein [Acinetobacter modestus]|uniref:hypothetical protein n=1 Tax=Acinetobacter modestus TaxID=1776740 RepID=UPI003209A719
MNFLNHVSNRFLFLCISFLVFFKIIIFVLIKNNFLKIPLGGGNDADYYHLYATGVEDIAVNIWPVILKYLNNLGVYSREIISYFLLLLNLFIIPVLVAKLSNLDFSQSQKTYLYTVFICSVYPTLFFYTFDIYRDVFMVSAFAIGCLIVKESLNSSKFIYFSFYYLMAILIGVFLLKLRPYLGYSFLLSLFLWKIKLTKKRIYFLGFFYFLLLFIANYIGLLDSLTEYRSGFDEGSGGSTLGLDFSNPVMFIPNFILSLLGQLFGLYITNPIAIFLFLIETVPFFFMLVYVIKNIKLADNFVRFLIIFFVLYASVWLIGNDNLGTAVRLRLYNYFAIYICFFYILNFKHKLKYQQVVKK